MDPYGFSITLDKNRQVLLMKSSFVNSTHVVGHELFQRNFVWTTHSSSNCKPLQFCRFMIYEPLIYHLTSIVATKFLLNSIRQFSCFRV